VKNTLKFYSKIYEPLFAKGYTQNTDRARVSLERFYEFIDKNGIKIKTAVDVGCAHGKALKFLSTRNIKAVGIDVSKRMVNKCIRGGFEAYFASATDLSLFPDKNFDIYLSADVYEHIRTEDLVDAIEEAKRITKKYLIIRPHPALDKRKTLHLTVWSIPQWKDFFESQHLKVLEYGDSTTFYRNSFIMKVI